MYIRFRLEKPFMSGKAARKSRASRSITLLPQPCAVCRVRISQPICQYSRINSALAASTARARAATTRVLMSASQSA